MSDVRLFHTSDGGEVEIANGQLLLGDGLETAAYLSVFGGNERDSGLTDGEPLQWWANVEERVATRKQRSQTQSLLRGIVATPENLARVEDAAVADLAWMIDELKASVSISASIPAVDRVQLDITIVIGTNRYTFRFGAKWSVE
jgi:phage gp46-like protein